MGPLISTRLVRSALVVGALSAGLLAVPAPQASAAPCIEIIPGVPLCLLPPAATTAPTITGTPKVGLEVSATVPQWDQPGVTTSYQWLRDGETIPGANTQTYELTGDDFDTMVTVRATGQGQGPLPGTAESAAVEPAKGDAITATQRPVLSGSPAIGGTLTTTDGEWGEPDPAFTYQWFRSRFSGNGAEKIEGATQNTYSPVAGDSGRAIVAVVTADRVGYEKGAAVSNPVRVPKADSTVALRLVRTTVKRTQAPSVTVTLASSVGLVPRGVVTIFDGTRRVRSFTLAQSANGTATFQISRQTVGRHRLTARYVGDTAHRTSTSAVRVLTVTR